MSVADDLFAASRAQGIAEDVILTALERAGIHCEDFSHDEYDASIELKDSKLAELSPVHLEEIRRLGFDRVWLHGVDGEKYYWL